MGSAIGAVTGGVVFSYYGGELTVKFYEALEEKIQVAVNKRENKDTLLKAKAFCNCLLCRWFKHFMFAKHHKSILFVWY